MVYRRTIAEKIIYALNIALVGGFAFLCIYPFWYLGVISLNDGFDSARGGIFLWPRIFSFENVGTILKWDMFLSAFNITILRVIVYVPLHIFVTSMAAYAMARKDFVLRNGIATYMLITMLFGGGLIPYYLVLFNLGLINNFLVYIIPGLFSVWTMIVMRTSFNAIPDSLVESAKLEGADDFMIYSRIIMPLSLPMVATLMLFATVGQWNDWFAGAFFVRNPKLIPMQTFVQYMLQRGGADDLMTAVARGELDKVLTESKVHKFTTVSLKYASVLIVSLPVIVVYPFIQKYFVKGVMIGSVKG